MEVIIGLTLLQSRLIKKIDPCLSAHGISFSEYLILHFLSRESTKTMRRIDLAESVGLSASGVTRLLSPMEKIGLIQKEESPRDARVSLVKLSRAGERIYQEASVSFADTANMLLGKLNKEQIERVLKFLQLLS